MKVFDSEVVTTLTKIFFLAYEKYPNSVIICQLLLTHCRHSHSKRVLYVDKWSGFVVNVTNWANNLETFVLLFTDVFLLKKTMLKDEII